MTKARIGLLFLFAAILFLLVAIVKPESSAVYIPLGVLFLILGVTSRTKKGEK